MKDMVSHSSHFTKNYLSVDP